MSAVQPVLGIVAGSGIDLTSLMDEIAQEEPFHYVPGLSNTGVVGHQGRFVYGRCRDLPVVLQCGRLHFYEGCDYTTVVRPVDVMKSRGVRTILFTNASGGLLPAMEPGDLLAVREICPWPYRGWPQIPSRITTDFTVSGCSHAGTYMWCHGPSYETRAEIGALQRLGGAAVGMSTAPEVHRCHDLHIRAGVISCITNSCCRPQKLTHADVLETSAKASSKVADLIRNSVPELNNA